MQLKTRFMIILRHFFPIMIYQVVFTFKIIFFFFSHDILTVALMTVARGEWWPDIFLRAGRTYRWLVTVADTGFPGSPNTSFFLPSYIKVANVVGFLKHKF